MKGWFGANDAKTSLMYFGYTSQPEHHEEEFRKVLERVKALEMTYVAHRWSDGTPNYSRPAVELSYVDDETPDKKVVAFRFTSDAAYDRYHPELLELGGGLGRGVWDPHKAGSYCPWLSNR